MCESHCTYRIVISLLDLLWGPCTIFCLGSSPVKYPFDHVEEVVQSQSYIFHDKT